MAYTRVFNSSVFDSYANLQNFFNQSPALQEVLNKNHSSYLDIPHPVNVKLSAKWKICQITTAPFRQILALFLHVIAESLACTGNQRNSKELRKRSNQLSIGFNIYSQQKTKMFQITHATNHPNAEAKAINEHANIPHSCVATSLANYTFQHTQSSVEFGHSKGICRGMSDWFLNLYLKTKDQFTEPRTHMAALGEQFKNGGGIDPTLLQSLILSDGKLLGLQIGISADLPSYNNHLIKYSCNEWTSQRSQVIKNLKTLPPGAYALALPFHVTAFIKIDNQLGYFFDPNYGIIEIQGSNVEKKLYKQVNKFLNQIENILTPYFKTKPISFTPYSPLSL